MEGNDLKGDVCLVWIRPGSVLPVYLGGLDPSSPGSEDAPRFYSWTDENAAGLIGPLRELDV